MAKQADPLDGYIATTTFREHGGGRIISVVAECLHCDWRCESVPAVWRGLAVQHAGEHGASIPVGTAPDRSGGIPLAEWEKRQHPPETQGQLHRRLGMAK